MVISATVSRNIDRETQVCHQLGLHLSILGAQPPSLHNEKRKKNILKWYQVQYTFKTMLMWVFSTTVFLSLGSESSKRCCQRLHMVVCTKLGCSKVKESVLSAFHNYMCVNCKKEKKNCIESMCYSDGSQSGIV